MLKAIKKAMHRKMCEWFGYRVVVLWGTQFVQHWTLSYSDAIDWMGCYPSDATVSVVVNGWTIAQRTTVK